MKVNKAENNGYTKKPSKLKNLVNGAIVDIKLSVPVISQHATGDYFSKQKEIAENLAGVQDGKEAGVIKNIGKGAVKQVVYTIPVVGTYKLGQAKANHETLKGVIDAEKNNTKFSPKKHGLIRTYLKGLDEKAKLCIPVYSMYYKGKMANEAENMLKDSETINSKKETE